MADTNPQKKRHSKTHLETLKSMFVCLESQKQWRDQSAELSVAQMQRLAQSSSSNHDGHVHQKITAHSTQLESDCFSASLDLIMKLG